jgi:hypothetical protein
MALAAAFLATDSVSAQTAQPTAYLIRQDFSDCTNQDVPKGDSLRIGGSMWVTRMPDGNTAVKVAMTAEAKTTYHLFLKCIRLLGDITTNDEGVAEASFVFPSNSVGPIFAFDMYPDGAPLGNKYQSSRIAFQ